MEGDEGDCHVDCCNDDQLLAYPLCNTAVTPGSIIGSQQGQRIDCLQAIVMRRSALPQGWSDVTAGYEASEDRSGAGAVLDLSGPVQTRDLFYE